MSVRFMFVLFVNFIQDNLVVICWERAVSLTFHSCCILIYAVLIVFVLLIIIIFFFQEDSIFCVNARLTYGPQFQRLTCH